MRLLTTVLLLLSFEASANTIVVSDIDDTLRHTNVRALHKLTVLKQSEFSGLSKLFGHLEKTVNRIEYVSGVPQQISEISAFFLFWNSYPEGRLFARDTQYETVVHKLKAIDQIVLENRPTQILMIGDNGEKDHEIYNTAAAKHANVQMDIFMHRLYDDEIPSNQTSWLTAIDLTVSLFARGLVNEEAVDDVLSLAASKLSGNKKDREQFFPSWAECRTFFKNYSRPDVKLSRSQEDIMQSYEKFLGRRCK